MRHYETKTKEVKEFIKTTCDICGNEAGCDGLHDVNEVVISHSIGYIWPEGPEIDTFAPDICGECFKVHIIPLLKSLGVNVEYD